MEKEMDMDYFFIKMEVIIKDNGKIIKWMDGENYSIKVEN
jgi:hypothetical protein